MYIFKKMLTGRTDEIIKQKDIKNKSKPRKELSVITIWDVKKKKFKNKKVKREKDRGKRRILNLSPWNLTK